MSGSRTRRSAQTRSTSRIRVMSCWMKKALPSGFSSLRWAMMRSASCFRLVECVSGVCVRDGDGSTATRQAGRLTFQLCKCEASRSA
jgi:hypothetical protein